MMTVGQETLARPLRCSSNATSWNDDLSRRFMELQNQAWGINALFRRTPELLITGVGKTARCCSSRNLRAEK